MLNSSPLTKIPSEVTTEGYTNSTQNILGKDDFLKLFLTQLRYQDPTKPLDINEMSQQMAQFSTVEQLYNISDELGQLKDIISNLSYGQAASFIGKEVEAGGNTVSVKDGIASLITVDLSDKANVSLDIFDSEGELVRVIDAGIHDAGQFNLLWDARFANGEIAPDGKYTFIVNATDSGGEPVEVTSRIKGVVDGVKIEDGKLYLVLGDESALVELNHVGVIKASNNDSDTASDL
ncbi:MAG: hypothetical protein DRG83_13265 [Deltaproteobacteria bacterium]|nr:MAG: hypothetical protein DRG83_13265 [Deltaproteobacteria bacterium]